jgi:peptidoglycan hydrolase-like protein with peptidoglycan-binding domain
MIAPRAIAVIALGGAFAVLAAACGHTRTVDDKGQATTEAPAENASPPHDRDAPARHRPTPVASANHDGDQDRATARADGPALTTSPAALLKPGALKAIQERLARDGVLSSDQATGEPNTATTNALVRFQRGHNLPATGTPDDATVRKLGLQPNDVFRSRAGG